MLSEAVEAATARLEAIKNGIAEAVNPPFVPKRRLVASATGVAAGYTVLLSKGLIGWGEPAQAAADYSGERWTINERNWFPMSYDTTLQWPGTSRLHERGGPYDAYDYAHQRFFGKATNMREREEERVNSWLAANGDHHADGGHCFELEAVGYMEAEPNDNIVPALEGFQKAPHLTWRDIKLGLLIGIWTPHSANFAFEQRSIDNLLNRWPRTPIMPNIPPVGKENENWWRQIIAREGDWLLVSNFPTTPDELNPDLDQKTVWMEKSRVRSVAEPGYVNFRYGQAIGATAQQEREARSGWPVDSDLNSDFVRHLVSGTPYRG